MGNVPSMARKCKIKQLISKIGVCLTCTLFFVLKCYASDSTMYYPDTGFVSVVDFGNDNYLYWGSEEKPYKEENGMTIDIKEESIASQWVDIEIKVSYEGLVEYGSKIDKFVVLANNKIIDEFEPRLVKGDDGRLTWSGTYYIKPSQSYFIGTLVQFQCVAVAKNTDTSVNAITPVYYGCLWSARSETFKFDDLPVSDENTHAWLLKIYNLLKTYLPAILEMLDYISDQISTLLTPSPQAQANLENAIDNFLKKTPMEQVKDELKDIADTTKNTSFTDKGDWKFGDKKDWFRIGYDCYLFDFTQWTSIIKTIRAFLDLCVWVVFFYFIIFYMLPKLDI